jgi:hypothetical protein
MSLCWTEQPQLLTMTRTAFQASKHISMPFNCTDTDGHTVCLANQVFVRTGILNPVSIEPPFYSLPANLSVQGCTAASLQPSWVINKLHFEQTRFALRIGDRAVPDFQNTGARNNSMELEIQNTANKYTESCIITDPVLNSINDTTKWLRCSSSNGTGNTQYAIETYVQVNVTDGSVKVNQTWFCDDTNPTSP